MKLNPFAGRERRADSTLENPSIDLVQALVAQTDGSSFSTVHLTPEKALRLTAVYASVRVIAESVASLPLPILQRQGEGPGRERLPGDPRWTLLNGFPNPEMTGMELFETWVAHALLWGRGYLYVVRNNAGQVLELWPLHPQRTEARRSKETNALYYVTLLANGQPKDLAKEDVIPLNSLMGLSPVTLAREALSSAAAAEEYAGRFWANNARPGGLIELPESMEEDEMEDFQRRWKAGHEGLKRSQLMGILTAGATWKEVGIAPGLAQFIETRQFGVREIARLFRVPPHMIGDLEGTVSRASIEQQSIEFVTYTLRPWIVRAEQALRLRLFTSRKDITQDVYPEFQVEGLMRGDVKSRYDAYAVGIQWGFLNRADPRVMESLPLPANANLEEYLVPMNMLPSSKLDEVKANGSPAGSAEANSLAWLSLMLRSDPELSEGLAKLSLDAAARRDRIAAELELDLA